MAHVLPKSAMSKEPNVQQLSRKAVHPRRVQPEHSWSLPEGKRQKLSHSPDGVVKDATKPTIPSKLSTSRNQGSEKSDTAANWFDRVNKNVADAHQGEKTLEDEPPFFMSSQANYVPDSVVSSSSEEAFGDLNQRDDSENDDLRDVIDDLTVENKRLKHLIKHSRSRASSNAESQDKLFEIRMHGLSIDKKRELELLLKDFAATLHTDVPSRSVSTGTHGSKINPSEASPAGHKTKHCLPQGQTDSGYGSCSISGLTSMANSHGGKATVPTSTMSRNRSIKNYLHDIPDTLLPQRRPVLSERAKMVVVVRRLEQLFTGKKAAPGEHSQPVQQQKVSQSAARADRHEDAKNNRRKQTEGAREAHILPADSKVNLDILERQNPSPPLKQTIPRTKFEGSDISPSEGKSSTSSRPNSPDQRPTRPLDLDIHRAQVAEENIEYIRHLGLTSPHIEHVYEDPEDSWIYLNLLISMAQIHTFNVTPAFVRRAIKKLSTKFELSPDGHKVRWRGGTEGTMFSKDEERAMEAPTEPATDSADDTALKSSKLTRSETNSTSNPITSNTPSEDKGSNQQTSDMSKLQTLTSATSVIPTNQVENKSKPSSAFDYKPILFRAKKYASPEESYLDSSNSSYGSMSGDSSGVGHALSRSNLKRSQESEGGMLTFFNNQYFYSDMTGDVAPTNWDPARHDYAMNTIGAPSDSGSRESTLRHHDACYFTSHFAPPPHRPQSTDPKLKFKSSAISEGGEEETQPIELAASGIGGVLPEDNFALDVKVCRTSTQRKQGRKQISLTRFGKSSTPQRFCYQTQACRRLDLQPSRLPPPTYLTFASSSSSEAVDLEEISEGSDSSSSVEEEHPVPPRFLQQWSTESDKMGDADERSLSDDDDAEEEESSSIDMLQAARQADPERIAEEERKFLLAQPEYGVPVAGSLAATVGTSQSALDSDDEDMQSDMSDGSSDEEMEDQT